MLGADDGGEVNLRYTWTVTQGPANSSSTVFTENGTNAAKNTTVIFPAAGVYTFEAVCTDTLDASSAPSYVTVEVVAAASRVSITPPSAFVMPGATLTFSAALVDQFGGGVAAPASGFTWTTSAGAVSSSGASVVFTAPALPSGTSSLSVTVSASTSVVSGPTYTGAATITVGDYFGLRDQGIASLTKTLASDNVINRLDMIQLLRVAGSDDNLVDAIELGDLRTILRDLATRFSIPNYVQILAGDVVNGNKANEHYLSQDWGNLAVGSSARQLNGLIDKWFLGTDHPFTDYSYTRGGGQLYVNGARYTDVKQGYLGDCYLLAALGAVAKSSPAAIQNMFLDNGDGTWTVRFFFNGLADFVTVDRWLATDSRGRLVYDNFGAVAASAATELWLPLLEKAYAQWNETGKTGRVAPAFPPPPPPDNSYEAIEGGWMQDVNAQALGKPSSVYWRFDAGTKQTMIAAIQSNKAVTLSTYRNAYDGLVGGHAYIVAGYNKATDKFTLYNPWGNTHPNPLTLTQLARSCQGFVVADPSGRTSATTVGTIPAAAVPSYSELSNLRAIRFDAIAAPVDDAPAAPIQAAPAQAITVLERIAEAEPLTAPAEFILSLRLSRPARISPAAIDAVLVSEIGLLS